MNSKFTKNVTTWGLKFYTVNLDLEKLKTLKDSEIRYIDCSDKNILELDRDLIVDIFKKFTNLKTLNLLENSAESLVSFNTLI